MENYDFGLDAKLGEDSRLECPAGVANLHQVGYRICTRDAYNDAVRVAMANANIALTHIMAHEIPVKDYPLVPGQRQWIEIDFACEQCGCEPSPVDPSINEVNLHAPTPGHTLVIYQHKGLTLIRWA